MKAKGRLNELSILAVEKENTKSLSCEEAETIQPKNHKKELLWKMQAADK